MANPITIQNWEQGVATSPFKGFGSMVGVDIFRRPGIIQNGVSLQQQGSFSFTGLVTAQLAFGSDVYYGTSDGKFYKNTTLIATTTGGSGIQDMVLVQNYIVISKANTTLDLYGDITGSPSYTNDWKTGLNVTDNTGNGKYGYKKMVVGQDNVLYIANGTALASQTGLYPSLSTTPGAIANASCLSTGLPTNRVAQTICEQNRYIVIVTSFGDGSTGRTRVYFMDRGTLDPSKTSFSLSIGVDIPERKINQIINQNNRLILFGNDTGTFYTTNSTTYSVVTMLPNRQIGASYTTYPNGITLLNNEILFGIGQPTVTTYSLQGIYSMQGESVIAKNIVSNLNYNAGSLLFGSILVIGNDAYQVGYVSSIGVSTVYLLDSTTLTQTLNGASSCWFETPMYETGTAVVPRKFQRIQFNLANNMVTGQSITVSYRLATNESYAGTKTYDYATYGVTGSVNSFHAPFPTINTTNIQLKVTLDSGIGAITGNEVQIQSIILE